MCGIFGSNNSERFKTLYELNKDRGSFAYGNMFLQEGEEPIVQKGNRDCIQFEPTSAQYYMGHTQGPTSAKRDFDPETSHPFKYLNWYIAHNGVLSNSKVLSEKYKVDNPVDSAVIPVMIWNKFVELYHPDVWVWEREQRAIKLACEELQGTFSCWIHNTDTNNVYLVRCGSTLFAGDKNFSSAQAEGMESLDDGGIYRLFHDADPGDSEWLTKVNEFDTSSPFFIL